MAMALAACSLLYELVFAQVISELTGNATIWESVSMAVFLAGMGVRSLWFSREGTIDLARKLVRTELALVACALISFLGVLALEVLYRMYVYDAGALDRDWGFPTSFILGSFAQVATFFMGWFSAFELQAFLHWPNAFGLRNREASVLAAYHFGALVGTLLFVLAHRSGVEPFHLLTATVCANLAFAVYFMVRAGVSVEFRRATVLTLIFLAASAAVFRPYQQLVLKNHYYNKFEWSFGSEGLHDVRHPLGPFEFARWAKELPEVVRVRTPFQVIDVVTQLESGDPAMFINGRFQVTAASSARYHETFAHVSLGYRRFAANRVLVLGGGDGVLAAELLRHRSVEKVDVVEIDPAVLHLARNDPGFRLLNGGALDDPRVEVHVADAMSFVRGKTGVYDAAFIDLTYPFDFDSARFYSVEFFRVIHRSLAQDGILVAGSPFDMVDSPTGVLARMVDATLASSGFAKFTAISNGNDHFVVVGKNELKGGWELGEGIELSAQVPRRIRTTPVRSPLPGPDALSIMRPRLLSAFDAFH